MHKFTLLAVAALSSLGIAQSPLTTLGGGGNQGNQGGGIYFNLEIHQTVTITQIDFNVAATTGATGILDVYLGPSTYEGNVTDPTLWTLVSSATAAIAANTMSNGVLAPSFALAPGNYGIALASNSFSHSYTNGTGCTSTTIPGSCTNSLFSNNEMTLRAGAAQNAFLTGSIFTPRIWNGAIHYTLGGTPIRVAAWETFGQGCYANYRSYYQIFPNPIGLNLGSTNGAPNAVTAFKMTFNGSGYDVAVTNTPFVQPTSAPVQLTSGDETFLASTALGAPLPFPIPHPLAGSVGVATDLEISTDGYIVPSPASMPNDGTPTVIEFLNNAPRWAPHWKNMDPTASTGAMHVELDPINGVLLVTWLSAFDTGSTTNASTFQVALFANGDVEYRYDAMSTNGGGGAPIIVGWTEGNGALDPGNIEIATALPFSTESTDNPPLTLAVNNRPVLGTNINLNTTEIPAGTTLGAQLIGFGQLAPPVALGAIGMPGCFSFTTGDVSFGFTITGSTASVPLSVTNTPSLNGAQLFPQSVTVSSGFNSLGVITSNGVILNLGTL